MSAPFFLVWVKQGLKELNQQRPALLPPSHLIGSRWRIRGDPSDWRSRSGVRAAGRDENWAHPTARSIVSRNTECPSYRSDRSITRALIGCAGESPFDRDAATFLVAEFAKPFSASRGLSHGEHANSIHFHAFCASLTSGATTMRPPLMALNASRSHHRLT